MGPFKRRGPQKAIAPHLQWQAWKSWDTVAVDLLNVPREVNTHDIYDNMSKEGNISCIDLWDNDQGEPAGRGPPPPKDIAWIFEPYRIKLRSGGFHLLELSLSQSHTETVPSPVRPKIRLPIETELRTMQVDIGVLLNESTLHFMQNFPAATQPRCVVSLQSKCLFLYFKVGIRGSGPARADLIQHDYRLKITFLQLSEVFKTFDDATQQTSLLIVLDDSVICHRKVKNPHITFNESRAWREEDSWYRQTTVTHNPSSQKNATTNLKRTGQVIDLGRWNVFKITLAPQILQNSNNKVPTHPADPLIQIRDIFRDYNIAIKDGYHFTESPDRPIPVWQWIDVSESGSTKASALLEDLENKTYEHLSFEVRYQLEVCMSQGYLSEYTMNQQFIQKLKSLGDTRARRLLEFVATERKRYLDPMKIFELNFFKGVTNSKIPSYCCHMHTARITPTTIYYNTPSVDISNRVVRQWSSSRKAGRFLRVRFTDEKTEGRINSSMGNANDEIYTRVKRTLANGITIGTRHYEFLAFGNSQFREHGAYFFASDAGISAATIRAWMGQFNHIRNVAKYAARLGQCFSTTRAFTTSSVKTVTVDDIVRNGYTFSDGVGKISPFLAQLLTEEYGIKTSNGKPPSAYQFRLGGSKGMLVTSPDPKHQEVHLRPSQQKFEATFNGLEIIRWSQFSLAVLNRQIIIVLSSLRIPDHIFRQKQEIMLSSFYEAMSSDTKAIALLRKYVDQNQTTLTLAKMVSNGFRRTNEPFMNTMLSLWRAWHLKYLKEKTRIVIDQGANLIGCLDETGTLKGYFRSSIPDASGGTYQQRLDALPEIFVQICRDDQSDEREIIEGICILARNPSLHPGDIRVVRAVNKPELHDLRDVVVLPQTGDQDVSGMCSGGDLDGDDYLVIWDPDLIPDDNEWFRQSMDFKSKKAPDVDHDVTVDEITSFFVTYMKNDCLPTIAHAHMAWADTMRDGVQSEKCLRLAKIHSDAVDYNKTGGVAIMGRDLKVKRWPHFMEKRSKTPSYRSHKILGQLYDAVVPPNFVPNLAMPFDSRILTSPLTGASEVFMDFARDLKVEWDTSMRQVMAQYEINTEFEVWSTFVLRHGGALRDYNLQEDLGRLVGTLRRGFRQSCYDKTGPDNIAAMVLAMYRVTEEQMSAALKAQQEEEILREDPKNVIVNSTQLPLITFPWVFPEVLGDLAMGRVQVPVLVPGLETDEQAAFPPSVAPMFDWTHARKVMDGMRDMQDVQDMMNRQAEDVDSGVFCDGNEADGDEDIESGGVQLTSRAGSRAANEGFAPKPDLGEKVEDSHSLVREQDNEMVEQDGDIKPSALDALINMINS
ncbi:RNA-dependent RNA polymerase eukaryotic-type [Penicillium brevicompactum]|uniref:RNA-dependent RNA polymerase n=1 Tax=Penicillium brevicompactum TaxID=5074 RepID=A0A9W9UW48_PENBR|nr:RNA-dependent RNA polymerase eukaryotic-type [Penicillium brevicompactum]